MDKEIWINDEKGYAELRYIWRKKVAGLFKVRVNTLAAVTPIERNRAQTLSEIAEKLERTREIFAARRKNRRDIYMGIKQSEMKKPKKQKCDVCGSSDIIEAPHMGKNCNTCHPLKKQR